jgi:site-specific recombinase XerD
MKISNNFAALIEAFFTDRLMRQRKVSPHTIAAYRDTFCLLLRFAQDRLKKTPASLTLDDLNVTFIIKFLDYLENDRGNSIRSRNARLAAIHSFFRYIALHEPDKSDLIRRVLAIPNKRYNRVQIEFLTEQETNAILAAPDINTWIGRRDRALILLAVQTGLRVSELTGLRRKDIVFGSGAHVCCQGKGRKERCTPLRKEVAATLRDWLKEINGKSSDAVFPNIRGSILGPDGVSCLLTKYTTIAQKTCPSLKNKKVTPHVLRHTAAMTLLQHGVDRSVIALWLGHEDPNTTQIYLDADLALKERALAKTSPTGVKWKKYQPDDKTLSFLRSL